MIFAVKNGMIFDVKKSCEKYIFSYIFYGIFFAVNFWHDF